MDNGITRTPGERLYILEALYLLNPTYFTDTYGYNPQTVS